MSEIRDIVIRKATLNDSEVIDRIQQRALEVLTNTEELDPVALDELQENIRHGLMAVAEVDGVVAAFRTMHIPEEDYLGPYYGIEDAAAEGLIYSDITIVDPDYRGLSLQRRLGEWLFSKMGDYKIIMATVHPNNTPSLKDKFHLGMQVIAMDRLYGGKLRFIFMKDLMHEYSFIDAVHVNRHDEAHINMLIKEGYRGFALEGEDIIFGKYSTKPLG
ncbi:N-acetyltransferase family protein [Macrococcus equi]|uniref:GNAT family N-acetyltransferase n=1 Tax=Macrococcus equi TaxID=3395462 RepID=UPI0039BE04EE